MVKRFIGAPLSTVLLTVIKYRAPLTPVDEASAAIHDCFTGGVQDDDLLCSSYSSIATKVLSEKEADDSCEICEAK